MIVNTRQVINVKEIERKLGFNINICITIIIECKVILFLSKRVKKKIFKF